MVSDIADESIVEEESNVADNDEGEGDYSALNRKEESYIFFYICSISSAHFA